MLVKAVLCGKNRVYNFNQEFEVTEMSDLKHPNLSADEVITCNLAHQIIDLPADSLWDCRWITPKLMKDIARYAVLYLEGIDQLRS